MKIKISKKRLQEIIQEEYTAHEAEKKNLFESQERVDEEEIDEELLSRAIAEVLAEEGLGDGEIKRIISFKEGEVVEIPHLGIVGRRGKLKYYDPTGENHIPVRVLQTNNEKYRKRTIVAVPEHYEARLYAESPDQTAVGSKDK